MKFLFLIPYRLIFWVKVINKKELRKLKGKPFILVGNHRNGLDGPTVFMTIPTRELCFWVKEEFFKTRFWRFIWRALGGIPVNANSALSLIRNSQKVLKQNKVLFIAPTGHRSFNSENDLKVQNGAAMVALKAGVPLVPFITDRPIKPFRLTQIKVGDMITMESEVTHSETKEAKTENVMNKESVKILTNKIQESMSSLLAGFEKLPKLKKWQKEQSVIARGIVICEEKLLVIKRNKNGEEYYVLPGGHIEEGETAADACKREVFEETGCEVFPFRELYKYIHIDKDKKYTRGNGWQTFFVCKYKSGEPHKTDAEEYTETDRGQGTYEPMWLPMKDLAKTLLKPLCIRNRLLENYAKKGARLSYPLRLIKGKR